MPTNRLAWWLAVAVLASTAGAADGPRLLTGDDRDGREVRAAAEAFLARLAGGDEDGAAALFAGPDEQRPLLAAQARVAKAADRLDEALARLPAPQGGEARPRQIGGLLRPRPALARRRLMALNGDEASLAGGGGIFDFPMDLRRVGGTWKVTDVLCGRARVGASLEFLDGFSAASNDTAARIEADEFDSADAAFDAFAERFRPAWEAWLEQSLDPAERPQQAEWQSPPAAGELTGVIGLPLTSPAVVALVASLPATPRLVESENATRVECLPGGIEFLGSGDGRRVRRVMLSSGDDGHSRRYPGELPRGLTWADRRRDVERKLGRPISSGGGERLGKYLAEYDDADVVLDVWYANESPRDPGNPVRGVGLGPLKPGKAAAKPAENRVGPRAPRPGFALRLVQEARVPPGPAGKPVPDGETTFVDPDDPAGRQVVSLEPAVLLDEAALEKVWHVPVGERGRGRGIALRMTEAGARKLAEVSEKNVGRRLGILIEGRLVSAPTIRSRIGRDVLIEGGAGDDPDKMRELCGRLHAAVFALRE